MWGFFWRLFLKQDIGTNPLKTGLKAVKTKNICVHITCYWGKASVC